MCGIVGITGCEDNRRMQVSLDLIAHRGPDDEGIISGDGITLGHCRLSIIDAKGGRQPMSAYGGRFSLIYNGEIYNYQNLRRRLTGVNFKTRSDTEVLLHWLVQHEVEGLSSLNGMFAFALWDREERTLLLARDRLGMKPLYTSLLSGGNIAFASEVKGLLPWIDSPSPNFAAIGQFLTFQNIIDQQTFFKGVEKLPPGSWLKWRPDGIETGSFWKPAKSTLESPIDPVAVFSETMNRVVDRQLISDVPIGCYLSSGIDSAAVAVTAAHALEEPIPCYTANFAPASPYYDERSGASSVARKFGGEISSVEIKPEDFAANLENMMWHLEEPSIGSGALPQYILAREAAKKLRVTLTGHGGDEFFAGYQVNKSVHLRESWSRGPGYFLKALLQVRPDEISRVLYFSLFPFLYPEVRHGLFIMTPRRRRSSSFSAELQEEMGGAEPLDLIEPIVKGLSLGDALTHLYVRAYLPTLLVQEDKMGMAHSLEARMPFCDNEMVDLGLNLSMSSKLEGGVLKAIPKRALKGVLPESLFSLPKRGFPTPIAPWFRTAPLRDIVEELLLSPRALERSIVDAKHVKRILKLHMLSTTENLADYARANYLYSLCTIEQWFRIFVDGDLKRSWS